jgi:dihydrofolate reductase
MGARFSANAVHYVFSRQTPPASVPAGVQFVTESIRAFSERLRTQVGKNVWMMGGGEIIGSFLDEAAIDEFIITVVPMFIGEGIPFLHRGIARWGSGYSAYDNFRTASFSCITSCSESR